MRRLRGQRPESQFSWAQLFWSPVALGRNGFRAANAAVGQRIRWLVYQRHTPRNRRSNLVAWTTMDSMIVDGLHSVGMDLHAAREALAAQTEIAKTAALAAAKAGVSEHAIARELGVARSRTVRRWLGKT